MQIPTSHLMLMFPLHCFRFKIQINQSEIDFRKAQRRVLQPQAERSTAPCGQGHRGTKAVACVRTEPRGSLPGTAVWNCLWLSPATGPTGLPQGRLPFQGLCPTGTLARRGACCPQPRSPPSPLTAPWKRVLRDTHLVGVGTKAQRGYPACTEWELRPSLAGWWPSEDHGQNPVPPGLRGLRSGLGFPNCAVSGWLSDF